MSLNMKYGGVCCQDATCREMIRPGYRCSASYGSPEYAMYMCPERKRQCGKAKKIKFNKQGNLKVKAKNLAVGDSCSYLIKAECGSPFFEVDQAETNGGDRFSIKYIEYDQTWVGEGKKCGLLEAPVVGHRRSKSRSPSPAKKEKNWWKK